MRCPVCQSPAPHLRPSAQQGGEVQPCANPFHQHETAQNTPAKIEAARLVLAKVPTGRR